MKEAVRLGKVLVLLPEVAMPEQELPLITRTYDLVKWSCQHTSKFPRNHRFVLGERIERRLYDLFETLIQARYTRDRQALLRQANLIPTHPRRWTARLLGRGARIRMACLRP
jgi:hypothetical protein